MNGLHDMGGMHGFGPVVVEKDEPVFHQRWEARVFGIVQSLGGGNIDAARHGIEQLDPVTYLRNGYYGRWFASMLRRLIELGIVGADELAAPRTRRRRRAPAAGAGAPWPPGSRSYAREIAAAPRFAPGQPVRTRNHQPAGHTRLPAYARGRDGIVVLRHAAMVFPDDHAHGRGENPQYLYAVRFDGRELWGDVAEAGTCVHLDLFESYLEPR